MPKFVDFALKYAEKGWHVFPLQPASKEPYPKSTLSINGEGGFKVATVEPEIITAWWQQWTHANVGIATGRISNLVVLDIDPGKRGHESLLDLIEQYGKLPDTVESLTGGGGRHILFLHPGIDIHNSAEKLGPGLDIRGDGGYIVAPPSIHPNGNMYQWELACLPSQVPVVEMPVWLLSLLTAEQPKQPPPMTTFDNPTGSWITQGKRDATLASMAGSMRRRGMSEQTIATALMSENKERCKPPLPDADILRIAKSIARYDPKEVPLFPGGKEPQIKTHEPLNAFGGIAMFLDLLDNLEGRSIYTFIPQIDTALGGLERQTLSVLAARPSMGKSTLGWQIARNIAAAGKIAYFFSMEMSAANLWAKAACGALGFRWRDFRNGSATPEQIERVKAKALELMETYGENILLDDYPNNSESIWNASERYRPDMIIVDHLRLINDRGDNEVQRLGEISKRLKELAKALNCHVMALAQLNRSVEGRDNKRPQMSDLRDSGQIEENADTILMMYRDDYYHDLKEKPVISQTEILVRKFRDDIANQRIVLPFNTRMQWFG